MSMHCPKCGQPQISDEVRYCSRCGFLLTGVAELVANDGQMPAVLAGGNQKDSPRRRGVKQGVFIFLLIVIILPLVSIFHMVTNTEPILAVLSAILLICGGLLRIVFALLFQSSDSAAAEAAGNSSAGVTGQLGKPAATPELSASQSIPAAVYTGPGTGSWRETNDLSVPGSVTDSTTRLLAKESDAQ